MYDSMLLQNGGGIIATSQMSDQFDGEASVIIGIGGTGVAALSRLKQKVYQQIKPDDPKSPVPEYEKIRFIAIDSDDTVSRGGGKGRLKESEFIKIKEQDLAKLFIDAKMKGLIKKDPLMNWFNIDEIAHQLAPDGAGGVRAVGRYLLFRNASKIKAQITDVCKSAMEASGTPVLNIYICAGISGGTGSGCFLDTCYIVRKIIDENAWAGNVKVMGFFFLPDVVISKLSSDNFGAITYNQSNGFAAMKELDYLMNMENSGACFEQNYGTFKIKTKLPPVDMCHLVSATKADGSLLPNGFSYCINVIADYILNYLTDIQGASKDIKIQDNDQGLTLRGHLANVGKGTAVLPIEFGAIRGYHVIGASNGEIPMTQIATYLAIGFYDRFLALAGRDRAKESISKEIVKKWAEKLELSAMSMRSKVQSGCSMLTLPEIDRKALQAIGPVPRGKLPSPWTTVHDNYLSHCDGIRERNTKGLKAALETYDYTKLVGTDTSSVIVRIYMALYQACKDPQFGPYYAAILLHSGGYDLRAFIDGIITELDGQRDDLFRYYDGVNGQGGAKDDVVQASVDFCHRPNKKNYLEYKEAATRMALLFNDIKTVDATIATMRSVRIAADELYEGFFAPLCAMLDNLRDTFKQNKEYLSTPESRESAAYTWQILGLDDVSGSLDLAISSLQEQGLVTDFMSYVLDGYDEWYSADEGRISIFISKYMEKEFQTVMDKSLQDYLYDKYPQVSSAKELSDRIKDDIIERIYRDADAMFWCASNYDINDDGHQSFATAAITVPVQSSAVCLAATSFSKQHRNVTVRKSDLKDRIFAMKFFSGIPFYAYQGMPQLKDAYDRSEGRTEGVGIHLYEKTGRGAGGDIDWRYYLPSPSAYSWDTELVDNADSVIDLYNRGCENGIIKQVVDRSTGVLTSKYEILQTVSDEFMESDESRYVTHDRGGKRIIDEVLLDSDISGLMQRLANWESDEYIEERYPLRNDGNGDLGKDVVDQVRLDFFFHYPILQAIVKEELDKRARIEQRVSRLQKIKDSFETSAREVRRFAYLLFYGILKCEDAFGNQNHARISRIHYEYVDGNQMPRDLELTSPGMDFGEKYPIYVAYMTYRGLDPNQKPRREMDTALSERLKQKLQEDDHYIARELELATGGDHLTDLEDELAGKRNGYDILQFYISFIAEVMDFRTKFPYEVWVKERSSARVTSSNTSDLKIWHVWTGTEYVEVYDSPAYPAGFGFSRSTNGWVPLQSGWLIASNGNWIPLELDNQNHPINLPR